MFEMPTICRNPGESSLAVDAVRRGGEGAGPVPAGTSGYQGPERRGATAWMTRLLALMLDEIDYGLLLVGEAGQVLHVNHVARAELDGQHPLQLQGALLQARNPQDAVPLTEALQAAARRGLRKMLTLGTSDHRVGVSVVPLPHAPSAMDMSVGLPEQATLLVLGKRRRCAALSVQGFARTHQLSPGEERVLSALCEGRRPLDIANHHGVKIATVRTQIASIRAKTGADSIGDLVQQVAVLPPQVSALRGLSNSMVGWPRAVLPAAATRRPDGLLFN